MKNRKETEREMSLRKASKGLLVHLLHRYAEPAVSAADDAIHKNVSVPIQKGLGIKVKPKIKTQDDFSDAFLNTLDSVNIAQLDKRVPNWREQVARGKTVRIGVRGRDYVNNYGGQDVKRTLFDRLTKPIYQMETTLGSYGVEATKDHIRTYDTYDFDKRVKPKPRSAYGYMRVLMNKLGSSSTDPDNEKIKIDIKSKRKQ